MMRRRLACCIRDREISLDFDEQERIRKYNGLETCILNNETYENESRTSRGDECATDSIEDHYSSCSSSKDASGSFSSQWLPIKKGEHSTDEWELSESPQHFYVKEKPAHAIQVADVEEMKDKFAKLLLGEDITGGKKGVSTALALSNAITDLAATVFGELWKLEPLPEERKSRWRREMDLLLSPTHYMVELVPAKQSSPHGGTLEIMTPKVRADIHMNLPALQKLDAMLIETMDSMVNTEFWYTEGGSRAEGRNKCEWKSKRWWLPSPKVPVSGLSDTVRKKLIYHGRVVCQVFKAAKSINETVLSEMPVPNLVREAICKSGKASLNEELYKILTTESSMSDDMINSLNLKSEHRALDAMNRLEAAVIAWKERIGGQVEGKSPGRTSWSFVKDSISERDKIDLRLDRALALQHQLRIRYPNLPQSFIDVQKIKYGKDVGHSILEAYSRVLGNLAFSILTRIRDILQVDALSNPDSPVPTTCFPGLSRRTDAPNTPIVGPRVRRILIDQMNCVDLMNCDPTTSSSSSYYDRELSISEDKGSSVTTTPSRVRSWCISREACINMSP